MTSSAPSFSASRSLPSYFPAWATEQLQSKLELQVESESEPQSSVTDDEPLLNEELQGQRLVLFPLQYPDVYAMCQKAIASFWTVAEVDLAHDLKDWRHLSDGEKRFLVTVLSFFAASDGVVNENLVLNFSAEVKVAEVRYFYSTQCMMESIHSEMYSILIQTLLQDDAGALNSALRALHTVPCVAAKAEWALRWTDASKASFGERLVAFACVEGIFFSASFCAIFWLKKRGLMPGLCFSNELISRDEGLHCDFACLLFKRHLKHKPSPDTVRAIVSSAVECELAFVQEALDVALIGMNADLMGQYVKYVADHLLQQLGEPKVYHVPNPFDWMEMISIEGRTNFFERRVGEYARPAGATAPTATDTTALAAFSLDEDF